MLAQDENRYINVLIDKILVRKSRFKKFAIYKPLNVMCIDLDLYLSLLKENGANSSILIY